MTEQRTIEFVRFYSLPGEGLVAEFRVPGDSMLFDRRGLQHRILALKRQGIDTSVEENALARMHALEEQQPGY